MTKRGKSLGWTPEKDKAVLEGKPVEGTTAQQRADRRYKMKKMLPERAARAARALIVQAERLMSFGIAPPCINPSFVKKLSEVESKLLNK